MSTIKDYIIYDDQHILVANKPSAMGVSRTRIHDRGFMQLIESYLKQSIYSVHRIDMPVSGVVLFAKTKKAAAALGLQFKEKQVSKIYLAVTRKKSAHTTGLWEDMIVKHLKGNKSSIMTDHDKSKKAICSFKYLESLEHIHLWALFPKTGRHHQLRVQVAHHIGAIRGDQKYGDKRGNRDRSIDLHAFQIGFIHPKTQEKVTFQAQPPAKSPWKLFSFFNSKNSTCQIQLEEQKSEH